MDVTLTISDFETKLLLSYAAMARERMKHHKPLQANSAIRDKLLTAYHEASLKRVEGME